MNLQENIRKVLREEKLHATPQELIRNLPDELKKLLFSQWSAKQNPEWHPEGNTLKHILVVIRRTYHHYPDDPNMVMAALFHDLGKMDTYKINPKTNQPTAYGHEDKSTDYVEQYRNWIESFEGTDVDEIKYLVKNHMKVKPSTWDQMKDKKKEPIKSHPAFDKLMGFTNKLDGGGTHLKESIRRILREEIGNKKHDKSKLIEKLLYTTFVIPNKDIVCKVEVKHPDDRGVLEDHPKYQSYSLTIIFIGGYGTKYWPTTMAVRHKYDDLMNEAWHITHDYTNTPCDIYYKVVNEC